MPDPSKEQFDKICKAVEAHLDEKIKALDYLKDLERRLQNMSEFIILSLKDAGQEHLAGYVQKQIELTLKREK